MLEMSFHIHTSLPISPRRDLAPIRSFSTRCALVRLLFGVKIEMFSLLVCLQFWLIVSQHSQIEAKLGSYMFTVLFQSAWWGNHPPRHDQCKTTKHTKYENRQYSTPLSQKYKAMRRVIQHKQTDQEEIKQNIYVYIYILKFSSMRLINILPSRKESESID